MGVENNRILIVEDEKPIRDAVSAYMESEGFWVTTAADGEAAMAEFAKHRFALVILDLMLPKMSGERVCRNIREESDVPIIMLTAKGEVEDRVLGLELGADDYLIKPFSPRELVARVRALLRRVNVDSVPVKELLDCGPMAIDVISRKVYINGERIDSITPSEFNLLVTMARYPGRVFSRMELVEKVLGYDYDGYERAIDSHIKNLRYKLGDNERTDKWIQTVHGVGYRFDAPGARGSLEDLEREMAKADERLEARIAEAEENSLLLQGRATTVARADRRKRDAALKAAEERTAAMERGEAAADVADVADVAVGDELATGRDDGGSSADERVADGDQAIDAAARDYHVSA
jgi:DNA-binding response OmpR family regulator